MNFGNVSREQVHWKMNYGNISKCIERSLSKLWKLFLWIVSENKMDKMKKRPSGARARKRELPERKRQEIQEAFTLFDNDKDGEIDFHELKVNT